MPAKREETFDSKLIFWWINLILSANYTKGIMQLPANAAKISRRLHSRMFKMKLNKLDKWEVGGVPLSELAPTLIKYGAIAGFLAALLALKHIF